MKTLQEIRNKITNYQLEIEILEEEELTLAFKQKGEEERKRILDRERAMTCLSCGKSLKRKILDRKIRIHFCEKCRIEEMYDKE